MHTTYLNSSPYHISKFFSTPHQKSQGCLTGNFSRAAPRARGALSVRVLVSALPFVRMASSAHAGAAEPARVRAAQEKAPQPAGEQSKLLPSSGSAGGEEQVEQSRWPSLKEAGALAAAIVLGASSPITRPGMVKLNARSDSPWHAVHVSVIVMGLGLTWLVVAAVVSERRTLCARSSPPGSPRWGAPRWWTFLGGFATAPAVASIPASLALGVQGAMLAMMAGQTLCALVLDVWFERSVRLGPWLVVGIAVVMAGIAVDEYGVAIALSSDDPGVFFSKPEWIVLKARVDPDGFDLRDVLYIAACALAGAGCAVQSLCIHHLASDLRSDLRATLVLRCIAELVLLPIAALVWASGVPPQVRFAEDWYIWLLCGAQDALFYLCVTLLARHLRYTPLFLCVLLGNLVCSSVIDDVGLVVQEVPFSWARGVALVMVVLGGGFYSFHVHLEKGRAGGGGGGASGGDV
jgi:uncharacterized membrane protein YdcZ (DUF606 family)